jgi:hypothetical protein
MHSRSTSSSDSSVVPTEETRTPAETAKVLKVSESWLAKARMRGDGPPFMLVGRSVRYLHLREWMEAQRRSSTRHRQLCRPRDGENDR